MKPIDIIQVSYKINEFIAFPFCSVVLSSGVSIHDGPGIESNVTFRLMDWIQCVCLFMFRTFIVDPINKNKYNIEW